MHRLTSLPYDVLWVGTAMMAVAVVGLVGLLTGIRRFDGLLLWALGGTTGAWLVVDHVHEVAILWTVTARHGLTVADLAAIPPVLIAGALMVRTGLTAHTAARATRRQH